jgi:hypothetical protein
VSSGGRGRRGDSRSREREDPAPYSPRGVGFPAVGDGEAGEAEAGEEAARGSLRPRRVGELERRAGDVEAGPCRGARGWAAASGSSCSPERAGREGRHWFTIQKVDGERGQPGDKKRLTGGAPQAVVGMEF